MTQAEKTQLICLNLLIIEDVQLLVGIPAPDATLCWGLQQTSSDGD